MNSRIYRIKSMLLFILMNGCGIISAWACTVCKSNQPKILQGITHGPGAESNWDYVIVLISVAVVIGTFVFSVKYLVKPGEANSTHVKYSILNSEDHD